MKWVRCFFYCFSLLILVWSPAQAAQEDVLAAALRTMSLPEQISFVQDISASGILGRWNFTATIKKDGDQLEVVAPGAPGIVPIEFLADMADLPRLLESFDLTFETRQEEAGVPCYVYKGERKKNIYTGATEGRICIDEQEYLIRRTEARYFWGTVRVTHTYMSVKGKAVLAKQEASVSPYLTRFTIVYGDYRF